MDTLSDTCVVSTETVFEGTSTDYIEPRLIQYQKAKQKRKMRRVDDEEECWYSSLSDG